MSSQQNESFNMNLLQNAPADGASTSAPAEEDGSNFAAQLAGGGGEFIVPTQTSRKISAGTIGFLLVAVIAGSALWYMKQRTGGPTPAEAADPSVTAARQSIQQFLAGGSGSVTEMKTMLADSEKITEKFSTYSENRQVPLEELKTNPFYHETPDAEETPLPTPRIDLSRQQQEAERFESERLAGEAAKFTVQSIFFGRNPTAMVNGKIVQVGQQLGEFTITAMRADAVEIKANGRTFELKLKH